MRRTLHSACAVGWLLLTPPGSPLSAADVPQFEVVALGFTGAQYTLSDGSRYSRSTDLNNSGQALGGSRVYSGSTWVGQSTWIWDGTSLNEIELDDPAHQMGGAGALNEAGQAVGTATFFNGTINLGAEAWFYDGTHARIVSPIDAEHVRSDGYRELVTGPFLTENGRVIGNSHRYAAMIDKGQTAWLWNGSQTVNIGPIDEVHTDPFNRRYAFATHFNQAGQAAGFAQRYTAFGSDWGQTAWVWDGSQTLDVGLADTEHMRTDGFRYGEVVLFNSRGNAVGESRRYAGYGDFGRSAWLWNGSETVRMGLVDAAHTRSDGYQLSEVYRMNQAGQVIGVSTPYIPSVSTTYARSAWFYDGTTTIEIGPAGAEYIHSNGYEDVAPSLIGTMGHVAGTARRFNATSGPGSHAWYWDGVETTIIGLNDAEHTRDDGYQYSEPLSLMDEAGRVIGFSSRYHGTATSLGESAWTYDGAATHRMGLTGPEYTRDDGSQYSRGFDMNELGQVRGSSRRYDGATDNGQTAWVYNPDSDETIPILMSERSDGYAYSIIHFLGENRVALGEYQLFDEFDNDLGSRAFYFSVETGALDLGSLVEGGFDADDWVGFGESAISGNAIGQIRGVASGTDLSGSGVFSYLFTPVPEPSSVVMTITGVLFLAPFMRGSRIKSPGFEKCFIATAANVGENIAG